MPFSSAPGVLLVGPTLLLGVACSGGAADPNAVTTGAPTVAGPTSGGTVDTGTTSALTSSTTLGTAAGMGGASAVTSDGGVSVTGASATASIGSSNTASAASTTSTGASVTTTTSGGGGTTASTTGDVATTSAGTTGSVNGDATCGAADEGASTTLTCPDGEVIDSVVFASYGTPTGACGSFAVGDCNSETSVSTVESLCVGRRACTVGAGNGVFGDPCNSVPKNLAVEVACVAGDPTAPDNMPYKGVANSPASEIAALGASWCYNWMSTPQASDCADPLFVPMIWGGGDVASAIQAIGNAGYDTVLGFNEPNKADQSNMTVAQAIELWPTLTSNPDIRVGSPAVSDDGRAWLEDFMSQVQSGGLRVDFIAMHWYGWNVGSCTANQLEAAVNWASQWGLPVWITEFGCMGSSNTDEQTLLDFFNTAIPMLDSHPLVERYAWYPWNTYNHLYSEGEITALGEAFSAAPQYRQ